MSKFKHNTGLQPIIVILALLLILFSFGQAYESELFREIDFFADKYQKNYVDYNLYDLSGNPAFFHLAYPRNMNLVQLSAGKEINSYHRYFDPERNENMSFNMTWVRCLNRKSILATGVKYYHTYQMNVERSLEKDFYEHYFSYSDTTNGDITYQGPELWVLYDYEINDHLTAGIELDYGVERGLKDIYTECETIHRNFDVKTGISFNSDSRLTNLGLSFRYFNRQAKYEAVKSYVSAMTRTWYGYHYFMLESPRSTSRKNDDRQGYEINIALEQKELLETRFGYRVSASWGEHQNKIRVGSVSNLHKRAYWQREGLHVAGNLFYQNNRLNIQVYDVYRKIYDWAEPKNFAVLALENDEIRNSLGAMIKFRLTKNFELQSGFDLTTIDCDYREHTAQFTYNENRASNLAMLGSRIHLNQISSIYLTGNYGTAEPDFHWQGTDKFDLFEINVGYCRQFIFGKIDVGLNYSVITPDNTDSQNEQFSLDIFLLK